MQAFELDARLAGDTFRLGRFELCEILLMDDARWPWLILVPMRPGLVEWHDLAPADLPLAAGEMARASSTLQRESGALKINTGAIGNMVRQLHLHVIARFSCDQNWPRPVWGHGHRTPYDAPRREEALTRLTAALGAEGMRQ